MLNLLHPQLVHFPIALLLTSVALDWAGLIWKDKGFDKAGWLTLLLGLAATAFTILSGLMAAQSIPADSPALAALNPHRLLGIITFVLFGLQAVCHWRNRAGYTTGKRILHTAIQAISVAALIGVGYFGGELVYAFGVGVSALAR
ncbi:MAG: DUF2231 domain-containing protein [Chloroflexi bacterium]|nr:DUF2231 domain-containing protein [Chloroflexota bacterium]